MEVTLIRNMRGENKRSMEIYANCLEAALKRNTPKLKIGHIAPRSLFESIGHQGFRGFISRFERLIGYRLGLKRERGDRDSLYHVTDHVLSYLLYKLPPKRTIVTCHDVTPLIAAKYSFGLKKISIKSLWHFKFKIRRISEAAHVIAVSESTRNDLIRLNICDPEKISVIYSGIPHPYAPMTRSERVRLRKSMGIGDETVLLHVGTSIFYKNIEGIIETLKILHKSKVGKRFVFYKAGEPFTVDQKRQIGDCGLVNCIRYIGSPNSFDEMLATYNIADILLFPSFYEGFGWPPIEAMACGIPVVCSDKGSLKEVVGDAALICDPFSPDSIAAQVIEVTEKNSLRNTLVERGLVRARMFNWDKTAKEVMNVYKKISFGIKY